MGKLTHKLQEAVKKLSYKTTVDQLKKKGIQKVNVVGLDRIVALIEAAVHRTLKARMAGFGGFEKRDEIADATREEFLKLLHSNQTLEQAREEIAGEKSQLEDEVEGLRDELRSVQTMLAEREAQMAREESVRAAAADDQLNAEVQGLLESIGVIDDPNVRDAVDQVLGLVRTRLDSERTRVTEARRAEHQHEVDQLNRRLSKLNSALQNSESQLKKVLKAKAIDPGIASVYDEVQGLDMQDSLFEQKKELMASIFEANVKLIKKG